MKSLFKQNKTIPALIITLFAFYIFVGIGVKIADAAWTPVQTVQVAVASGNCAITVSATTQGNLLVVYMKPQSSLTTNTSVTDDVGNTYVIGTLQTSSDALATVTMAYGVQTTGGATSITITFGGQDLAKRCGADEYHSSNGPLTSNATTFDVESTGTGVGTAGAVTTFNPATSGELIVGVMVRQQTSTWTAGTNYTLYGGAASSSARTQYRLSGTTSETAPFTLFSSVNWSAAAMAFIEPTPASVVKTIRGLIRASVKTINGMAIANIKKFNGVQ